MPVGKFNTYVLEAEARTFNTSILADEVDMTPEDTARAQIQAEEERPDLTFGRITQGGRILAAGPDRLVYTIGSDRIAVHDFASGEPRVFAGSEPAPMRTKPASNDSFNFFCDLLFDSRRCSFSVN